MLFRKGGQSGKKTIESSGAELKPEKLQDVTYADSEIAF